MSEVFGQGIQGTLDGVDVALQALLQHHHSRRLILVVEDATGVSGSRVYLRPFLFGPTSDLCHKPFSLPLRFLPFPCFPYFPCRTHPISGGRRCAFCLCLGQQGTTEFGGISEPPLTVSFSGISEPLLKGNKVRTTPGLSRRF
jgi:hypothetical protein